MLKFQLLLFFFRQQIAAITDSFSDNEDCAAVLNILDFMSLYFADALSKRSCIVLPGLIIYDLQRIIIKQQLIYN